MIREFIKDLIKYLPAQIVPAIMGLITIIVVTRLFSPEDYGNYVLVISTVAVLSTIAVAWLTNSTGRFFPAYNLGVKLGEFYSLLFKLSLISIGIVCLTFLIGLFFTEGHISANLHNLMYIGTLIFVATSLFIVLNSLFRAKRQVNWYSLSIIWKSVIGLGLGILLVVVFHMGVEGLLWGVLLSLVIALPLLWKISLGKPLWWESKIRSPMSWELAKYGIPAMAINLSFWVLSLSDRYILQFFRGSYEVGIYSASYSISEQSILIFATLFMLPSTIIGYNIWENRAVKESQEFVAGVNRYYLLLTFPAMVGLSVLAKPITALFVSPEYYAGYMIIPPVAIAIFISGIADQFSIGLKFYKRTGLLLYCFSGAALLNIGLNFLLIPIYGYIAAAITTLVSYVFFLIVVIIVSRRFFVWKFPFKSLGKAASASVIMALVVYPMGNGLTSSTLINLIVSIFVGVIVYFAVLFLLRETRQDEIQELRRIVDVVLNKIGLKI